ncbi:MAG: hypothetical protein NTW36_14530 [Planctomycetia bacterium]|nr:hypothetical protein [Planctomycetia bacterium]
MNGYAGQRGASAGVMPAGLLLLPLFLLLVTGLSCGGPATPGRTAGERPSDIVRVTPAMPQAVRDKLLDGAMAVLGRLEDYDEASAFAQVFDRLNQWSHAVAIDGNAAVDAWTLDPLVDTLPADLRAGVTAESLASSVFDAANDMPALRDQRWLADIVDSARGDAIDDVEIARNLFDWTVRSLAIVSDPPMVPTVANPGTRWFLPGEILLAGRASAAQRAWIFLELLRHAGLDGVMLATGSAADGTLRPWIPALISGGEAHLFEPAYGMPIPGPAGMGVATARQAAADPAILAAVSLPDRPYPVKAADIANLSVLVPGTRENLARRMHLLDGRLAGRRKIDLAVDATALGARAVAALPGGAATGRVLLWEFPWEVHRRRRQDAPAVAAAARRDLASLAIVLEPSGPDGPRRSMRPLYAARLREFRGDRDGPEGAKSAYLLARPSNAVIAEAVKRSPPEQADAVKRLYEGMKQDATYWLGVLTLAEGQFAAAEDYLGRMTLDAMPDGRWADAARTNLAQAKLALGDTAAAIALLRADPSPQRFGSRLLADRLEKAANTEAGAAAAQGGPFQPASPPARGGLQAE